eukprot:g3827.t1
MTRLVFELLTSWLFTRTDYTAESLAKEHVHVKLNGLLWFDGFSQIMAFRQDVALLIGSARIQMRSIKTRALNGFCIS